MLTAPPGMIGAPAPAAYGVPGTVPPGAGVPPGSYGYQGYGM